MCLCGGQDEEGEAEMVQACEEKILGHPIQKICDTGLKFRCGRVISEARMNEDDKILELKSQHSQ
ncbi:hypothetical protein H5410_064122 [Solanum commersonii]|uniref:Uncharacterized protein n=1 Tax=Solanum commersonii TaxID=4109 RepID=A0A9J5W138_SOLCO|nr:hypothetical protein H5410_064122 [Solanum commersonii]